MVTITANDSSSELTSCVRRGPFAIPDRPLDHELSGDGKHDFALSRPSSTCPLRTKMKDFNTSCLENERYVHLRRSTPSSTS